MRQGFWQNLDRDVAVQPRVARQKDLPNAAFADRLGDGVDAKTRARGEGDRGRYWTTATISFDAGLVPHALTASTRA